MSKSKVFAETFGTLTYYPVRGAYNYPAEVNFYFNIESWLNMDEVYDMRDALDNVIRYHEKLEKGEGDD